MREALHKSSTVQRIIVQLALFEPVSNSSPCEWYCVGGGIECGSKSNLNNMDFCCGLLACVQCYPAVFLVRLQPCMPLRLNLYSPNMQSQPGRLCAAPIFMLAECSRVC